MAKESRSEWLANQEIVASVQPDTINGYRVGRNALTHGPIRTYPAPRGIVTRVLRAILFWL